MPKKNRVAYFYDNALGNFYFAKNHPMKPPRLAMTHHLILGYELHKSMDIYKPREATPSELAAFHSPGYLDFLYEVNMENQHLYQDDFQKYGIDWESPVFDGLAEFCGLYTGASIEGAQFLANGSYDIAINWSGGLHHAKKFGASGFCYVNDLVLAILELLKTYPRVLYVDIDVHHGDGVEEAFYTSDRVFTVSFHKFGEDFFPGTGQLSDVGEGLGRHYALNVPLQDGVDDTCFHSLFKPIMEEVIHVFKPSAIVLQCGADSLAKDRLGVFNLSLNGHSEAVRFMKRFNIPLLVTGGGGYTKSNVARCWAYETSVLVGKEIDEHIPPNIYYNYYAPDHTISIEPNKDVLNRNSSKDMKKIAENAFDYLHHLSADCATNLEKFPPRSCIRQVHPDNEEKEERIKRYTWQHFRSRDHPEDEQLKKRHCTYL